MTDKQGLSEEAFSVFREHVQAHAEKILRLAKSGYSFEEWLNWEFYLACAERNRWSVKPKPSYKDLGGPKRLAADLRLDQSNSTLLVEVGHVHDTTGNKWIKKLDGDTKKLHKKNRGQAIGMQVILVASKGEIVGNDTWRRWLDQVGIWGEKTHLEHSQTIHDKGSILLRGWTLPND